MGAISWRHALTAIIAGLAGMLVFISAFSATTYRLSGLELQASVHIIDGGVTEVVIPPLGSIRAHTHMPPLKYRLELRALDADKLHELADLLAAGDVASRIKTQLLAFMRGFLLRVVALGVLGSAAFALAVGYRRPGSVALAGLAGMVVLSAFILVSVGSYHAEAFGQPQFTGALAAAPWMVGLAEQSVGRVAQLGEQLKALTTNLYRVFESMQTIGALGQVTSDRTILIVSDIHNNPAAIEMIARVVETFQPDFIIDAGDITDYGTDFEAEGLSRLGKLDLQYVLVPGNHDSPSVIAQLEALPNVQVLVDQFATVAGVKMYGIADPGSKSMSAEAATTTEVQGRIVAATHALDQGGLPVVFVTHDPRVAQPFYNGDAARVPVVISGHTHRMSIRTDGGRVWIDPGTTGAAGIRGLMSPRELPYSLVLLYLRATSTGNAPDTDWQPTAVDTLRVSNLEGSFTIERKIIVPAAGTPGG